MHEGWIEYNSFCRYCTGNDNKEVKNCKDKYCPFYQYRFADLDKTKESEFIEIILKECGVKH